jgi:hypothetical protein
LGGIDRDPHLAGLAAERDIAAAGDQCEHLSVLEQDVCLQVRHTAGRGGNNGVEQIGA